MQAGYIMVGVGAIILTIGSTIAERARQRRRNLEDVGYMPWTLLTILGTMAALYAFAFAVKFA